MTQQNQEKVKKGKGGRPTVMTPDVLAKLEQAFMYTFSDAEACLFAGVSVDALYDYQKKNPEYAKRKETLRLSPNLKAKKVLVESIDGRLDQARWWADHKMGKDFAVVTKVEHSGSVGTAPSSTDPQFIEQEQKLRDQYHDGLRKLVIGDPLPVKQKPT